MKRRRLAFKSWPRKYDWRIAAAPEASMSFECEGNLQLHGRNSYEDDWRCVKHGGLRARGQLMHPHT